MPSPHNTTIIGELMNNSYARARKAWLERNVEGYQKLARRQSEFGASYLTLNLDGTQKLAVDFEAMLAFLPELIPAIQEVTDLPLSFDNPHAAFHRKAVECVNRDRMRGRPILNSIAASRKNVDEMIAIAAEYDMDIIVMASERVGDQGEILPAKSPKDIVEAALYFCDKLMASAGVPPSRVVIDPGLCPIASDTGGLVNMCLDAIRGIRMHPDLKDTHLSVGLSNFSIGSPRESHALLERAFLTLAREAGLDYALANPEKNIIPLNQGHPWVERLQTVLDAGRRQPGEDPEDAGFRQLEAFMEFRSDPPALPAE